MKNSVLLSLIFFTFNSNAEIAITPFVGMANSTFTHSNIFIDAEVDLLHSDFVNPNYILGGKLGYVFQNLQLGGMYLYSNPHPKGDVWLYQISSLNDFRFHTNIKAQSFLGYVQYELPKKINNYSPFVTLGLGATTHHAAYSETPKNADAGDPIELAAYSGTTFSYALGLGTKINLANNRYLSLQYQFMRLGQLSFQDITAQILKAPIETNLYQHQLILGYTFLI